MIEESFKQGEPSTTHRATASQHLQSKMTYQNAGNTFYQSQSSMIKSTVHNTSRKTQSQYHSIECHFVECHVTTSHLFLSVGSNENLTDQWLAYIQTVN